MREVTADADARTGAVWQRALALLVEAPSEVADAQARADFVVARAICRGGGLDGIDGLEFLQVDYHVAVAAAGAETGVGVAARFGLHLGWVLVWIGLGAGTVEVPLLVGSTVKWRQ